MILAHLQHSVLFQLYANSDDIPTADEVYAQFKKQYSQDEADEILGPNTDHDDIRKVGFLFQRAVLCCQGSTARAGGKNIQLASQLERALIAPKCLCKSNYID